MLDSSNFAFGRLPFLRLRKEDGFCSQGRLPAALADFGTCDQAPLFVVDLQHQMTASRVSNVKEKIVA